MALVANLERAHSTKTPSRKVFITVKLAYCPVSISSWRRNVGIKSKKRAEQKQEAIDLVKSKYGVDVNEDIAEAILLSEFNNFE